MGFARTKKRLRVICDPSLCMGCRSCELECAIAHSRSKGLYEILRAGERPEHRINVEAYGRRAVPVHCSHCEEPACVLACPTGAVYKDEQSGTVQVDQLRCIGCKMCVQACPFGVITMSADGRGVLKCDQCLERLAEGKEPACVSACPTKALVFGDEDAINRAKRRKAAERMVEAQNRAKGAEEA